MADNGKCPGCGAVRGTQVRQPAYECSSHGTGSSFYESENCVRNQRDQQRKRAEKAETKNGELETAIIQKDKQIAELEADIDHMHQDLAGEST